MRVPSSVCVTGRLEGGPLGMRQLEMDPSLLVPSDAVALLVRLLIKLPQSDLGAWWSWLCLDPTVDGKWVKWGANGEEEEGPMLPTGAAEGTTAPL